MANEMTTAAALIDYRKELIEGGFDQDAAELMARDAAQAIIGNSGALAVRDA